MGIVKFGYHEGEAERQSAPASLSRGPAIRVRTLCGCERILKEEPGGRELLIPMQSANGALYGERRFKRELDSEGKYFWLEVNRTPSDEEMRVVGQYRMASDRVRELQRVIDEKDETIAEQARELSRLRRGKR